MPPLQVNCCYLLRSLNVKHKNSTYIGFTTNPKRRIRQHNGELTMGAWRTKSRRPWQMIAVVLGFPTKVAAQQFEWAWQHPADSKTVRESVKGLTNKYGARAKLHLLHVMLGLPPFDAWPLSLRLVDDSIKELCAGLPPLPPHLLGPIDQLYMYTEAPKRKPRAAAAGIAAADSEGDSDASDTASTASSAVDLARPVKRRGPKAKAAPVGAGAGIAMAVAVQRRAAVGVPSVSASAPALAAPPRAMLPAQHKHHTSKLAVEQNRDSSSQTSNTTVLASPQRDYPVDNAMDLDNINEVDGKSVASSRLSDDAPVSLDGFDSDGMGLMESSSEDEGMKTGAAAAAGPGTGARDASRALSVFLDDHDSVVDLTLPSTRKPIERRAAAEEAALDLDDMGDAGADAVFGSRLSPQVSFASVAQAADSALASSSSWPPCVVCGTPVCTTLDMGHPYADCGFCGAVAHVICFANTFRAQNTKRPPTDSLIPTSGACPQAGCNAINLWPDVVRRARRRGPLDLRIGELAAEQAKRKPKSKAPATSALRVEPGDSAVMAAASIPAVPARTSAKRSRKLGSTKSSAAPSPVAMGGSLLVAPTDQPLATTAPAAEIADRDDLPFAERVRRRLAASEIPDYAL